MDLEICHQCLNKINRVDMFAADKGKILKIKIYTPSSQDHYCFLYYMGKNIRKIYKNFYIFGNKILVQHMNEKGQTVKYGFHELKCLQKIFHKLDISMIHQAKDCPCFAQHFLFGIKEKA